MDRGAWRATVHGVTRVGHDLVTKPPPPPNTMQVSLKAIESLHVPGNQEGRAYMYLPPPESAPSAHLC